MQKQPTVYILASKRNGTLYIGVTTDLVKRIWQHKNNLIDGFTKKYQIYHLVYYEIHSEMREAIKREKQLKKWNREWKIKLIEKNNPEWNDLFDDISDYGFPDTASLLKACGNDYLRGYSFSPEQTYSVIPECSYRGSKLLLAIETKPPK